MSVSDKKIGNKLNNAPAGAGMPMKNKWFFAGATEKRANLKDMHNVKNKPHNQKAWW